MINKIISPRDESELVELATSLFFLLFINQYLSPLFLRMKFWFCASIGHRVFSLSVQSSTVQTHLVSVLLAWTVQYSTQTHLVSVLLVCTVQYSTQTHLVSVLLVCAVQYSTGTFSELHFDGFLTWRHQISQSNHENLYLSCFFLPTTHQYAELADRAIVRNDSISCYKT